ncbi:MULTISPECIES: RNA polymerase sigma factor [unclassified Achromobacter]|uniref:RNA polymerase sigma factor n=1 Tax=unclassified Achromobacter TaxID=2626865 RepID=UPI000B51D5AA|nr:MULTISPECIES: RNA polymerase sigma factor [unclassified Achromobacter]OWT73431.1 RNA polymerase subunit sigma-24 [Achromobacter sp. HZ34]OWT79651.1 RNA polymerase subunit sigma-24 [Achromobacter sp. HZ28]
MRGVSSSARAAAAIEAVWRDEAAKVIAGVARVVRDVSLAEDLAQDALVAALEHWPRQGVPDNPGAWLMTTAKNRALDRLRQDTLHARKQEQLGADLDALGARVEPDFVPALDAARQDDIGDDVLRLMFVACHPALSRDVRVTLTLRLVGGLSTTEIARAFLASEATIAQRIVRAKRSLAQARLPFEVPGAAERAQRLDAVLEVIYLIFNEGYAATSGEDWARPALCEEALRVGRLLARLALTDSETMGLLALMELQASRLPARADAQGRMVLLADQDRDRWDAVAITRGLAALDSALTLASQAGVGAYTIQAALAACHARARRVEDTDWAAIVGWYDVLDRVAPGPVVRLNRAVALGMAQGPAVALQEVDALTVALSDYPWLHAVRGDLLMKLGRDNEARQSFKDAAALTDNAREREQLLKRAQQ